MTAPSDETSREEPLARVALVVLLVATAVAFVPGLGDEFVYDDHRFVPDNAAIRDLRNLPGFFSDARTMTATQGVEGWNDIYRPLRTLSFAIDWQLFGDNATGYRLENLLLHLLAVFLAWRLLARLLGSPSLAVLGAGVFALHPLQAQTVSWISSRGDLLAAVALLGAALLLLREEPGLLRIAGGAALYAVALLGKENAVALLALVPVHDLLFAERPAERLLRRLPVYGILFAITVAFLVTRFQVATAQGATGGDVLLGAGSGTLVVVGQALAPVSLLCYTGDVLHAGRMRVVTGGVALGVAGLVVLLAVVRGRRRPLPAFGILWAAIAFAPVSGIIPLKTVAESRFAYLPLVGAGLLLALAARRCGRGGAGLAVAVLVLLGSSAARESHTWSGDRILWETAVAREDATLGGAGDIALANLAIARAGDRDLDLAEDALRRALGIRPTAETWANLSLVLSEKGDPAGALRAAEAGVRLDPGNAPARHRLGLVLLRRGWHEKAIEQLGTAVDLAPDYVAAQSDLGRAYLRAARIPEAVNHLRIAIRLAPDVGRLHVWLGQALLAGGRPEEALSSFAGAAARDPSDPEALLWIGRAHLHSGRPDEARRALERSLALDSGNPVVFGEYLATIAQLEGRLSEIHVQQLRACARDLENLGKLDELLTILGRPGLWNFDIHDLRLQLVRILLQAGQHEEARERLLQIRETRPNDVSVLANLGLVELELGQPENAISYLRAALDLDSESFVLWMGLARAYGVSGQANEARAAAKEAMRRASDPDQTSEARLFLAGLE